MARAKEQDNVKTSQEC